MNFKAAHTIMYSAVIPDGVIPVYMLGLPV